MKSLISDAGFPGLSDIMIRKFILELPMTKRKQLSNLVELQSAFIFLWCKNGIPENFITIEEIFSRIVRNTARKDNLYINRL